MKRIIVFFLLFVSSMLLFAEWKESCFVDDFGDPTDSRFAYTSGYGQFSNSATSNSKMYYMVLVYPYSGDNTEGVTSLKIRFDLHDYSFETPVHSYYSDTYAYYSIKDEEGNVYSFRKNNTLTSWNSVIGNEAVEIYKLMLSNKTLKVAVSVESAKYIFTLDCEGVREVVEPIVARMQQKYPLGVWTVSKSQLSFDAMNDWIYCSVFSSAGDYVVKTILSGHTSKEPEISFSTHQSLEGFVTNDCLSGYIQATFTTSNGSIVYKTKGSSIECDFSKLFVLLRDADILEVELLVDDETVSYKLDAKDFLEQLELFKGGRSSQEKDGNVTSFNVLSCKNSETNQETHTNGGAPIEKGDYGGIFLASVSIPFEYKGSLNFYLLRHKMVMPYVAFEILGSEFRIPIGITYVPIEGVLLFSGVEFGQSIGIQAGATLFYKYVAASVCVSRDFASKSNYIFLGLGFGGYNGEPYRKTLF